VSDQTEHETYVRKFSFRPFSGVRRGRLYRVITIGWFNLVESVRRSGFTKFLLFMMVISLIIQDILPIAFVRLFSSYYVDFLGITVNDLFRGVYTESVLGMVSLTNRIGVDYISGFSPFAFTSIGTSLMWLLLLSIIGGGLVADDRLFRTTEAYYSRVSRFEYTIGKLLSLVIFSTLVITLPAALQYVLLTMGLDTGFATNADLLLWAVGFTAMAAVALSLLMLAISSMTKRRGVATLVLFILALIMSGLPSAFGSWYMSDSPVLLMDFVGSIAMLGTMILGRSYITVNGVRVEFYNGTGLEGYMVGAVVGLVFLVGFLALFLNLLRRDT
jgi:hypothetical protein